MKDNELFEAMQNTLSVLGEEWESVNYGGELHFCMLSEKAKVILEGYLESIRKVLTEHVIDFMIWQGDENDSNSWCVVVYC
ncbi:hypothetical protein SAMN04487977_101498 [Treponema bryantii]|uniref:Uncharacterized protein n=1 Tax=Treponema bryantii TaxID=163 RepID=A0A1H9AWM7_9SPIR|nr:hypothetical protein [Treponema bryantii]SEP81166.1 hypothetical protein SAMN04487977_101498 [Treponema bryantii]